MRIRESLISKIHGLTIRQGIPLFALLFSICSCTVPAQISPKTITVHLRGVSESNISLIALTGPKQLKPIAGVNGIRNGQTSALKVPGEYIPGVFVLRFDYKEKKESTPYPSERRILISKQDLEFWVNPVYVNHPDSTRFQKNEKENTAFTLFSKENSRLKEKLGLLQQFLMNYDDTQSKFYRQGIEEYGKRRQAYNQWLNACVNKDKTLFVSSLYRFHFLPEISWEGSEQDRMNSLISHFFDGIDFNDPNLTKTPDLTDWMDSYVNLYGQKAVTVKLRDSLIPAASKTAIEHAKMGNPIVYGWMVDYFYKGFESNNIPQGMKTLEPYLNDPNCLTSKRMEIQRRLQGMEKLVDGSSAPNIRLPAADGSIFELNTFKTSAKYILIMFWSADCSHCTETVDAIYPWQKQPGITRQLSVIAVSLDETETEKKAWDQKIKSLKEWKHLRAPDGIRSKAASDYFVLATPVMILIDAQTKKIVAQPGNFPQLAQIIQKES